MYGSKGAETAAPPAVNLDQEFAGGITYQHGDGRTEHAKDLDEAIELCGFLGGMSREGAAMAIKLGMMGMKAESFESRERELPVDDFLSPADSFLSDPNAREDAMSSKTEAGSPKAEKNSAESQDKESSVEVEVEAHSQTDTDGVANSESVEVDSKNMETREGPTVAMTTPAATETPTVAETQKTIDDVYKDAEVPTATSEAPTDVAEVSAYDGNTATIHEPVTREVRVESQLEAAGSIQESASDEFAAPMMPAKSEVPTAGVKEFKTAESVEVQIDKTAHDSVEGDKKTPVEGVADQVAVEEQVSVVDERSGLVTSQDLMEFHRDMLQTANSEPTVEAAELIDTVAIIETSDEKDAESIEADDISGIREIEETLPAMDAAYTLPLFEQLTQDQDRQKEAVSPEMIQHSTIPEVVSAAESVADSAAAKEVIQELIAVVSKSIALEGEAAVETEAVPISGINTEEVMTLAAEIEYEIERASKDSELYEAGSRHISSEVTQKLLQLLEALGYQNPREVLLQYVSRHNLEFLLQTIQHLSALLREGNRQEFSSFISSKYAVSSRPLSCRIGKAILGLLAVRSTQPESVLGLGR